MINTLYSFFGISENATQDEIDRAYSLKLKENSYNPNLSKEANDENKIFLDKIKIAYDILSNPEERARYDKNVAKQRQEELFNKMNRNAQSSSEKKEENIKPLKVVDKYAEEETYYDDENINTSKVKHVSESSQSTNTTLNNEVNKDFNNNISSSNVELTAEEKARLKEAAQNKFNDNLRKVQLAEEEYKKAYNDAYNQYMKKTNGPSTFEKIKMTVIVIFILIIVCGIIWILPPTRNMLMDVYNDNIIIKGIVDFIIGLFK